MIAAVASPAPARILLVSLDRVERDRPQEQAGDCHQAAGGHGGPCEEGLQECEELRDQLLADGHEVPHGHTVAHARALARSRAPELVLVQTQDRLREALELVSEIRGGGEDKRREEADDTRVTSPPPRGHCSPSPWNECVPVVVVALRRSRIDVVRAFDAGADDYLATPLFYPELRVRLGALLARGRAPGSVSVVRAGAITIDTAARSVTLDGRRPLALPRLQYELLLALAREPRRVVARSELVRRLWGEHLPYSTRTLDSHASRLRRALCTEEGERWIVSVRGVGYRLR